MPGMGTAAPTAGREPFRRFFRAVVGHAPYPYQERLAFEPWPETLIIPTGLGKTAAVLAAWLWRVSQSDPSTPRRLVYCLPMRTLVEQTEAVARCWTAAAASELRLGPVQVAALMGGSGSPRTRVPVWMLEPALPTLLVGTQDLLVSAALMRAYGASRYRWPVDFALLHAGAFWVLDEVQLAGAALTTSAQLEGLRRAFGTPRESRTLWMSATLDPAWLRTPDFIPADSARPHDLGSEDLARAAPIWGAQKQLSRWAQPLAAGKAGEAAYCASLAAGVLERAQAGATTLVIVNRVARAQTVYRALKARAPGADLVLLHSRFRPKDRAARMQAVLAPQGERAKIIIATQALEAGVDLTSATLVTELAPWSSLVQRFGRCNRFGECAGSVVWIDAGTENPEPYSAAELEFARQRLLLLNACGPADLAGLAPSPPARGQVLRRRDLLDLFDTESDLSGFDLDVSPYVREADDTDVRIFWRSLPDGDASGQAAAARDELCAAPIGVARQLLKRKPNAAWIWDGLEERWQSAKADDLYPGATLLFDAAAGGYSAELGLAAELEDPVLPLDAGEGAPPDAMAGDERSRYSVSLAKHTLHVQHEIGVVADALGADDLRALLHEVARWHDAGKAHASFAERTGSAGPLLAKFAHATGKQSRPHSYFRHELASALAYLAAQDWRDEASLAAYLIAAHHGKVRMRVRALPRERGPRDSRRFARGVWDGDPLPSIALADGELPACVLDLGVANVGDGAHGASWTTRAQRLLRELGPFRLAWLEALVRIADWRASAAEDEEGHDDL